jgi:hypothetical protein
VIGAEASRDLARELPDLDRVAREQRGPLDLLELQKSCGAAAVTRGDVVRPLVLELATLCIVRRRQARLPNIPFGVQASESAGEDVGGGFRRRTRNSTRRTKCELAANVIQKTNTVARDPGTTGNAAMVRVLKKVKLERPEIGIREIGQRAAI